VDRSSTAAAAAVAAAKILVAGSGAQALGIAASAVCCPGEDGTMRVEWDVYVLIRRYPPRAALGHSHVRMAPTAGDPQHWSDQQT